MIVWDEFHVHGNRELAWAMDALVDFGRLPHDLRSLEIRVRKLELKRGRGEGKTGPKGKLP